MKRIKEYILEKFKISKDINIKLNKEDNEYVKIFYFFLKEHSFFDINEDEYTYDITDKYVKLYLPENCNAREFVGTCTTEISKMLDKEHIQYKYVSFGKNNDFLIIHL